MHNAFSVMVTFLNIIKASNGSNALCVKNRDTKTVQDIQAECMSVIFVNRLMNSH